MTRNYPAANIRASDADRDAVLAELGEHFQAGRLTSEELGERTGRALTARTGQDLATIMTDLPAAGADRSPERGRLRSARFGIPIVLIAAAIGLSAAGHAGGGGLLLVIPIALLAARRMRRCDRRREDAAGDCRP